MTPLTPFAFEPLASHHNRVAFACQEPTLETYLKRQASQDVKRHLATCFVLVAKPGSPVIMGYYILSSYMVQMTVLPTDVAKTSGRYPQVPAVLLGRLAVDTHFQGQGWGSVLLLGALRRVLNARTQVAVKLVVLDALHEQAAAFYAHFGFHRFIDNALRLYVTMDEIEAIFPGE
jgi:GNAT superfamily N-acetyltransferase